MQDVMTNPRNDKYKANKNKNYRTSKERVKICPECNWQWEARITAGYSYATNQQVRYHPNTLPTYGKEIEICGICEKKK